MNKKQFMKELRSMWTEKNGLRYEVSNRKLRQLARRLESDYPELGWEGRLNKYKLEISLMVISMTQGGE